MTFLCSCPTMPLQVPFWLYSPNKLSLDGTISKLTKYEHVNIELSKTIF